MEAPQCWSLCLKVALSKRDGGGHGKEGRLLSGVTVVSGGRDFERNPGTRMWRQTFPASPWCLKFKAVESDEKNACLWKMGVRKDLRKTHIGAVICFINDDAGDCDVENVTENIVGEVRALF